ncbi:hypothetical protein BX600DRAFT_545677 [Xylariales sp. PMI_506]|nr:hypothetical protein BX600DRAFT_545677 [Xylariales sp. PMI_506]
MSRMRWDAGVHEDILVAMVDSINPTQDQYERIIAQLSQMGYTFSSSALKQHLMKLRKKDGGDGASPAKSAQGSPGRHGGTPSKKAGGSAKRKAPQPLSFDDSDGDIDRDIPTPSKKAKRKIGDEDDEDVKPSAVLNSLPAASKLKNATSASYSSGIPFATEIKDEVGEV